MRVVPLQCVVVLVSLVGVLLFVIFGLMCICGYCLRSVGVVRLVLCVRCRCRVVVGVVGVVCVWCVGVVVCLWWGLWWLVRVVCVYSVTRRLCLVGWVCVLHVLGFFHVVV